MIKSNKEVVAVTGGAGLIGSYLVDLLVEEGYKVVIDDFSKGSIQNLNKNLNKLIFEKVILRILILLIKH